MNAAPPLKLLLIESEPFFERGLVSFIQQQPGWKLGGSTAEAKIARKLVHQQQPQIILLDLDLENGDPLTLLAEWRTLRPRPICIVLGRSVDPFTVQRLFAAGARGYLHRGDPPEEILRAIERAQSDLHYASPRISSALVECLAIGRLASGQAPPHGLSEREWDVFRRVGQGECRSLIAERLGISKRTVETHCERIKIKLGVETMEALRDAARKKPLTFPDSTG